MDWIKTDDGNPDHPMRNPAAAAKLLAELRGDDPLTALNRLTGWLQAIKAAPDGDETIRSEILSRIQEASHPHVSALLAQFFVKPTENQAELASTWRSISNYLAALTAALYASAGILLKEAATNPSLQLPAAAGAARALHACRSLVKACLVRYLSVPPQLWRMAYGVHREAEAANCAEVPVRMHASQKTVTTVTQELLRLLMLQSCAPEMMAPGQIEVADWVVEQLGADFVLGPCGVADNPFCFDPAGEGPPCRAADPPDPDAGVRYFGAGPGHDALVRIYKQLETAQSAELRFGKEIPPHLQITAVQHLLVFWSPESPYSPPTRSPATGKLSVVHGYEQSWQQVSRARSTGELRLVEDDDDRPAQAAETWTLQDTGGNELGVEIPRQSGHWVRCGEVVGVSIDGDGEWWLGVIRSVHSEPRLGLHANVYIISRDPRAIQVRAIIEKGEENPFSDESARAFAFNRVRVIIISDGSEESQPPNMLLPPESWREGRVFESTAEGPARYLRGVRILRRGDDYVRARFEWTEQP